MKKQFLIVLSVLTGLLAACSTANFAYYDDIYTSSGEKPAVKSVPATAQAATATPTAEPDSIIYETDENGNLLRTLTYYPGSTEPVITTYMEVADDATATAGASGSYAYDPDDYYDYSYSSRIRRFHTDVYAGWGYYDPYFTNMYWYDYCPASWGLSIYMGYNWWWPGYYYRPYYYTPYWYDYGFRYGWGWGYPYYAWDPYCPGPHGPHGPMPIDWYHNSHDQNHSYYYGHRNNLGPSVGNGGRGDDRGERPDGNHGMAGGYGNGETNNHYSVNTTPTSFNQRYESLAGGTTGAGSSYGGNNSNKPAVTNPRTELTTPTNVNASELKPRPVTTNTSTGGSSTSNPTTVTSPRTETPAANNNTRPTTTLSTSGSSNSTSVSRPTTTTTTTRSAATTTQAPKTVTRTVVTPSSVTTRPATTAPRTTTTTRPATTTPSSTRNYGTPSYQNPSSSSSSSSRPAYNNSSSNSRSNYNTPSSSRPSSYSSPSTSRPSSTPSRPSTAPSSSSRSSYSSPSSSSRSSYSSGSSHSSGSSSSRSSSGGGGGSHGGGGRR